MRNWEGIEEFLAVVEAGGFTAAARRLGVSPSHVSRQVAGLEDRLGIKLLARSTRMVRLTEAGASYHGRIVGLAAGIEEANRAAAGEAAQLEGLIRLSAGGSFAEDRLAPVMVDFARLHPGLRIEMDFNTRNVDLVEEGFDFAVRYGELGDSDLIARRLTLRPIACAAAPHYLAERGVPTHPTALERHDCILANRNLWRFAEPGTGAPIEVRVRGRWRGTNARAMCAAAEAGLGVVYTSLETVDAAIADGRLTRLLEGFEEPARASWIVYPERRHMPLRVRRAIDHVIAAFA
ncbi:MAG: LysR family transcriptional regulator [Pseudomonadota bacterium]